MDRYRLGENAKDIAFELVEVHHATVGRIRNPKHVGSVRHFKDGTFDGGVLPSRSVYIDNSRKTRSASWIGVKQ